MERKIIVFGSSISWGAWDGEGGWVARLKKLVNQKVIETNGNYWTIVYNQSVSGDTSSGILDRFEKDTLKRIRENQEIIIIFEIGINDSTYVNTENEFRVPKQIFSQNIEELIKKARKITNHIFFIGSPPVIDKILDPIQRHPTETLLNKNIKDFNQITFHKCKEKNIEYIDIFSEFEKHDLKKFISPDGYHPNTQGHELIYKLVKKSLNKYLLI